jgi:uncharacterized protein
VPKVDAADFVQKKREIGEGRAMGNQQWGVVVAAILVCLTIIFAMGRLQQTGITIEDNRSQEPGKKEETGEKKGQVAEQQKSISVSGEGRIVVVPDHVRISAGVSELAETTAKAQEQANRKLARVLEILKANEIPERNIQTSQLTFRPEYDWSDGERRLIGQRVAQTLDISIPEIDVRPERVTRILDLLGAINRLEMHSVNFDVKNRKELLSRARILAFEEAKEKAEALTRLAGLSLEKPLQISEVPGNAGPVPYFRGTPRMDMAAAAPEAVLPAGEMDVTITVNVVFAAK